MLRDVYTHLLTAYGPQHWWPGDSSLEIVVGAILTQHTSWRNVEHALANLKTAGCLDLDVLCDLAADPLAELLRPAGYYRVKAQRLQSVTRFIRNRYGSLEQMWEVPLPTLRTELLGVHGVGPETADSILLYAGGYPTFVVDVYTKRVCTRHRWTDADANYAALKSFFESQLGADAPLYNEFHALLVRVGKQHCGPQADCQGCPLECMLPAEGLLDADIRRP